MTSSTTTKEMEMVMNRIFLDRLVVRWATFFVAAIMLTVVGGSSRTLAQSRQLSLADILIALRSKKAVPEEKNQILTADVKERGITFALTSEIEKELGSTGAQASLIAAIREKTPPVKTDKPEAAPIIPVVKTAAPETVVKPVPPPPPDFAFYRT